MRLQLVGPMSGMEDWNYPLFNEMAKTLRSQGHDVYNPAETFGGDTTYPRRDYMRASIGALLRVEGIVLLPGWETSPGAKLELRIALALSLHILNGDFMEREIPDAPDD